MCCKSKKGCKPFKFTLAMLLGTGIVYLIKNYDISITVSRKTKLPAETPEKPESYVPEYIDIVGSYDTEYSAGIYNKYETDTVTSEELEGSNETINSCFSQQILEDNWTDNPEGGKAEQKTEPDEKKDSDEDIDDGDNGIHCQKL